MAQDKLKAFEVQVKTLPSAEVWGLLSMHALLDRMISLTPTFSYLHLVVCILLLTYSRSGRKGKIIVIVCCADQALVDVRTASRLW